MPPPSSEDTNVLERERSERKREQVERASIAMGVVGDGEYLLAFENSLSVR